MASSTRPAPAGRAEGRAEGPRHTYVLDTSVLLSDPRAIARFKEHEVVLHEEEVVTEKRTVPKERVRLDKETITDEQTVSDQVRKEQIDTEGVEKKGGKQRRR